MPDIFEYLDYRDFLRDFYQEKKKQNPSFSYRVLADKAGFRSKSFFPQVLDGSRNLSEESILALGKMLKIDEKEMEYFKTLVSFNQAKTHSNKQHFFSQLMAMNSHTKRHIVINEKHAYYLEWYHSTIRELVTIVDFKDDYTLLARFVKPSISANQAKKSVELLLKLRLIAKDGERYIQTDPDISSGAQVQSFAVEQFHQQNFHLAAESIDLCPGKDRDISSIVAGLNSESFERVKEEIRTFRKLLISIINQSTDPNRVYHISMQIFPTSEKYDRSSIR